MKRTSLTPLSKTNPRSLVIGLFISAALMLSISTITAYAQGTQLDLADILIALRSKKLTLPERNKILTDAVIARGITFSLTPEIEKELSVTGADKGLLDSIRQKSPIVKVASVVQSAPTETKPKPEPIATPAPPDFSFYEKRANDSRSKGDLDAALADYTKAIEMNGSAIGALLGRGSVYQEKSSDTQALADFTKAIEVNPKNAFGYARRGEVYEKKGDLDLASADYKKALEIDPANETAKAGSSRVEAERAKIAKKPEPVPAPTTTTTQAVPEFVDLGQLSESRAVKMVKPLYPQMAFGGEMGGKITVEVEIDTSGNVTSAKAVSGNPYLRKYSEDAARTSKFKPAQVGDKPVKAKGFIVYNFVRRT